MKIKFLGAAGTVTGSSYLLTPESGKSILIDLGMFQGGEEIEKFNYLNPNFEPSQLAGVVLTHAHLDHCGRIPMLVEWGFKGEVWMTPATRDIVELSLYDSAKIGKEEMKRRNKPALYTAKQVGEMVKKFRTVEYGTPFKLGNFEIEFTDAGHILGSASAVIKENDQTIVFSGDLGNSPEDLIKPTEPITAADAVVMESTYGDGVHPVEDISALIALEINAVEESGGTLLIPVFSIERAQEMLHRIDHLKKDGKVKNETPVFMDSPMAEKTTIIFGKYQKLWNAELQQDAVTDDPFNFPGLVVLQHRQHGKVLEKVGGKVIMAGSGMMSGGRIVGHAKEYLPRANTRLLIVGYQAEGTLGREILSGNKKVIIEGIETEVRATINEIKSMSSHADQPRLLSWLKQIGGVKKVFIIHGEARQRQTLAEKIKADLGIMNVVIPEMNEEIGL